MAEPGGAESGWPAGLAGQLRAELDQLRAQAATRAIIERATGILMERLGCPPEEARSQLARLAAEAGTDRAGIAADIAGEALRGLPAPARRAAARADAAVAAAPDVAGLAEALLAEALSTEGAAAVAVWVLAPDGGIELAGEAGFGPREAARLRRIPPGVPCLPQRAIRLDAEIWWAAGQPPGDDSILIGWPGAARAIVPLREAGTCIGALEACWPRALPEFPAAARGKLSAIALPCARALSAGTPAADYSRSWLLGLLEGLHESVLYARPAHGEQPDEAGLRIEWASRGFHDPAGRTASDVVGRRLAEAYQEGGLARAAAQVLASGQPERVPGGAPSAGGEASGSGVQAAVAHLLDGVVIMWEGSGPAGSAPEDSGETGRLAALLEVVQWLGNTGGWEEDIRTGEVRWTPPVFTLFGLPPGQPVPLAALSQWVPAQDAPAVEAFRDRLLRQGEPATAAFRIIRRDDASLRQLRASAHPVSGPGGEVIAVRGAYQDVSAKYHTEAAFTATREQLIGTEERARAERELVMRLQQAITPEVARPVEAAGLDVAARYRPSSEDHLVGGDWYDSALLPGKNVLLTVGDVAGHGIGAVTGMVALRNALRGLAVTGAGTAQLMTWLNTAALHLADVMATAICAVYDPSARTLHWARAGHLPPLLIRDGTACTLPAPRGPLLGAIPDASYQEAIVTLRLGDVLVFFTDGLIERRNQPIDEALARLARLASHRVTDVGQLATSLLAAAPSDTGDDTCLVAVRIR